MKRTPLKRPQRIERVCDVCGDAFCRAPSQGGRFCSLRCSHAWRATPEGRAEQARRALAGRSPSPNNRRGRVTDRERFNDPRRRCRWPGCERRSGKLDQHHVVYRQEVRRRGGDIWDGANALALCAAHHATHHHQLTPFPLAALRDENYAYALALMGPAAFDYLRRRYVGEDPRLDALLISAAGRHPA